ncbi:hypothetical protein [Kamptonema formosum]|nr:hypothetical protein [Oscillatoria sp. PCC 10802]
MDILQRSKYARIDVTSTRKWERFPERERMRERSFCHFPPRWTA